MRAMRLTIIAMALGLAMACSNASITNPVAGQEYRKVDGAGAVTPGTKIEVTEFFWYSCPHCNAFDPYLADWVKAQGNHIEFKRIPVAFHPGDENLQKLYFALEMLGQTEQLHSKIFHAIHVDNAHLNDESAIADFVATQGIDRAAFVAAFQSFSVSTMVQHARQSAANYQVDSVPTLVIGGRYVTSPSMAGASLGGQPEVNYYQATFKVSDWLVNKASR